MSKSEDTRDRILDAALNIFSNKGYHDTRMDEIVEASDTSKGSIYFHFPNKERLFLALVDQFADLLERQSDRSGRAGSAGHHAGARRRCKPALKPSGATAAPPKSCWCRRSAWAACSRRSASRSTTASPG